MNEINFISLTSDEVVFSERELSARLKLPPGFYPDEVKRATEKIISVSQIKGTFVLCDYSSDESGMISFDFGKVKSASLFKFLSPCKECVFFAVTLGMGVERYLSSLADISVTDRYFADAVASAYIESACDRLQQIVEDRFGGSTGRFSPGYGDLPIEFQIPLLERIDAKRRLGISLTNSMLMIPGKSISGIIGVKNARKE